jgi:predicted RNA-binding protein YlxR (DUF448 family)
VTREKHTPVRTCMGCGQPGPRSEMLRLSPGGPRGLRLVERRDVAGRTGYLHRRPACWDRFAARKGPLRSLRRTVDRETRTVLVAHLKATASSAMMG